MRTLGIWEEQYDQCDKQMLSLDSGAYESSSKGIQHLNIRGA